MDLREQAAPAEFLEVHPMNADLGCRMPGRSNLLAFANQRPDCRCGHPDRTASGIFGLNRRYQTTVSQTSQTRNVSELRSQSLQRQHIWIALGLNEGPGRLRHDFLRCFAKADI